MCCFIHNKRPGFSIALQSDVRAGTLSGFVFSSLGRLPMAAVCIYQSDIPTAATMGRAIAEVKSWSE